MNPVVDVISQLRLQATYWNVINEQCTETEVFAKSYHLVASWET